MGYRLDKTWGHTLAVESSDMCDAQRVRDERDAYLSVITVITILVVLDRHGLADAAV